MNVLLVEDEFPKMEDLQEFFAVRHPDSTICTARSVRSAVDAVRSTTDFDLIILDMSLPTFDITPTETGGKPQGFGGVEVLRYLKKLDARAMVIIVTAFEAFTSDAKTITLDDLRLKLKAEFPANFYGAIYYNVIFKSWVQELENMIDTFGGN